MNTVTTITDVAAIRKRCVDTGKEQDDVNVQRLRVEMNYEDDTYSLIHHYLQLWGYERLRVEEIRVINVVLHLDRDVRSFPSPLGSYSPPVRNQLILRGIAIGNGCAAACTSYSYYSPRSPSESTSLSRIPSRSVPGSVHTLTLPMIGPPGSLRSVLQSNGMGTGSGPIGVVERMKTIPSFDLLLTRQGPQEVQKDVSRANYYRLVRKHLYEDHGMGVMSVHDDQELLGEYGKLRHLLLCRWMSMFHPYELRTLYDLYPEGKPPILDETQVVTTLIRNSDSLRAFQSSSGQYCIHDCGVTCTGPAEYRITGCLEVGKLLLGSDDGSILALHQKLKSQKYALVVERRFHTALEATSELMRLRTWALSYR